MCCRLEAQLDQERIIHEQELQCLRQQHKDAERNMDVALAETKETAETQRHQYEEQLRQLAYRLNEAKYKVVESEVDGKEKAALIERLANEKQVELQGICFFFKFMSKNLYLTLGNKN